MKEQEQQVLQEAEAIIDAEVESLHQKSLKLGAVMEARVVELEVTACITHEQAHDCFDIYMRAMYEAAKSFPGGMEEFLKTVPNARKMIFLGMVVGAYLSGNELGFEYIKPEENPGDSPA